MSSEPETHRISDEGSIHKYATLIPNTVVRGLKSRGLSIYAKWLYVYIKSRAGESGICHCSTTTIAIEAGMSRGQVSAAKKELLDHGLISLRPGKNPRRNADNMRIKDIWLANMQEFSVHNMNTEERDEEHETKEQEASSVHNTNTEVKSVHDMNSVFTIRTECSPHEQLRRSQEEDPKKKDPEGSARAREKPAKGSKRCPTDYEPSPAVRQWAQDKHPAIDFDEALEAVRDYEFSKLHYDWDATLKTWIRNEAKEAKKSQGYRRAPPPTRAEQRAAAEEQSNRELEDLVCGRNTHNSVWASPRRDRQDVWKDVGPRRQSRLPDGGR